MNNEMGSHGVHLWPLLVKGSCGCIFETFCSYAIFIRSRVSDLFIAQTGWTFGHLLSNLQYVAWSLNHLLEIWLKFLLSENWKGWGAKEKWNCTPSWWRCCCIWRLWSGQQTTCLRNYNTMKRVSRGLIFRWIFYSAIKISQKHCGAHFPCKWCRPKQSKKTSHTMK